MEKDELLIERLKKYGDSGMYPFHMPGHKRREQFPNPFSVDITEIEGFDNLHHAEGILKDSMEWAAGVYGVSQTCYLVNGSSCGILSAICGCTDFGGRILMSRNCHKSAYHGVFLHHLKADYLYPQMIEKLGIQGGILPEDVENALKAHPDIQAVLVVSPTYDGVVSDIRSIGEIAHRYGAALIVDEAHGAHFPFGEMFPVSALGLGADVVIQSVHKTLPSLTQTAVLHMQDGVISREKIGRYLTIFQSSSPSYVLMASIEQCIWQMNLTGRKQMDRFHERLSKMRRELSRMKRLKLAGKELVGTRGVYDLDESKIVISAGCSGLSGQQLSELLRGKYLLEPEMCGADYVVCITTPEDGEEALERLKTAFLEIDDAAVTAAGAKTGAEIADRPELPQPQIKLSLHQAMNGVCETIPLEQSEGRISGEFIYLYPPGIPIVAPGEKMTAPVLERIMSYLKLGLPVQGLRDHSCRTIDVLTKETLVRE